MFSRLLPIILLSFFSLTQAQTIYQVNTSQVSKKSFKDYIDSLSSVGGKKSIGIAYDVTIGTGKTTIPINIDLCSFMNGAKFKAQHTDGRDSLIIYQQSACPMYAIYDTNLTIIYKSGAIKAANVLWWGQNTKAIQCAINSISNCGGVVFFDPTKTYAITSQITINSNYPITVLSNMGAINSATPSNGYINIAASFAGSVFNITNVGGAISGLWFRDSTSNLGYTQGNNSINSVIKLVNFGMGKIQNCFFDGIRGSAIEVNNMIRGHIDNVHIRDCGTYTKPSIWFNGSGAQTIGQVTITGLHAEVCRGSYLSIDSNSTSTKIDLGQFEADPAIDSSNNYFIYNNGTNTIISHCGFNANTRTQVFSRGSNMNISNCQFSHSASVYSAPRLVLTGSFINVNACDFFGTPAAKDSTINDVGGNNFFSNCQLYYCGSAYLGNYSTWTGGGFYNCKSTKDYMLFAKNSNTITGTFINKCDSSGGIFLAVNSTAIGNNIISNEKIGIYCQGASAIAIGNHLTGNKGGNFVNQSSFPRSYFSNANTIETDSVPMLQYEATYNPDSLASGASLSANINIPGSKLGDVILASFPVVAHGSGVSGMQISASPINDVGDIRVSFTNNTGAGVNLDSGLLTVKILKK